MMSMICGNNLRFNNAAPAALGKREFELLLK